MALPQPTALAFEPYPYPYLYPYPYPYPCCRYDDDRTALARRHALVVRAAALVCRRHGLGLPIEDVGRPRSRGQAL